MQLLWEAGSVCFVNYSFIVSYVPLPTVYEREGRTERAWDIYSRLLRDRIIFIGTPINDFVANAVIAQLLFLQMEDPKKDISLYINSPGGSVTDGMAIYDTIKFLQCDVVTYCVGQAASMATLLGCRYGGQALCFAKQSRNDAPAIGWCRRADFGYFDCCP